MNRTPRILLFVSIISLLISCKPGPDPGITAGEVGEIIEILASDAFGGRYPGTPEDVRVSAYIARNFKQAGLRLYEKSGLQPFDIVTEIEAGSENLARCGSILFEPGVDFSPFSFSANGNVSAEVVFAGYGIRVNQEELQWDDYAGMEVAGKIALILRGVPGNQEASSPLINYSEDRGKALLASDQGAAGVIFVSGGQYNPDDALEELQGKQHALFIPVIQMTRAGAERLLALGGSDSLCRLDAKIESEGKSHSFSTGIRMDLSVDLQPKKVKTANTIAFLKGSDPLLDNEFIVIGAHHDHLGMGGPGTSSRNWDTTAVHHGADDNASGVAGVIEISENMVSRAPARSMVFATFAAEEMGLIGSRYLTENSPVDLAQVRAMINLDMIGRLNEQRQLQIGGIGTSPVFEALIDSLNGPFGFDLKYANEGYGPSDHASFYAQDIPVLFISTGAHADYHTPNDRAEAINLEGAAEVMAFVADLAEALANEKEPVAFTEAGPKVKGSSMGRRGGITLGLMPDVTYDGNDGMPVMFVTEGKPASVGGIQNGDIIVAIEGKSVGNVYDYMSRLDQLKEGMDIVVTVRREGDIMYLVIRL